ncbi:MAG: xanthine dehydrogenase accessory protein XdhC [Hyphomicrobiales bacterium]|nr:xanthine dehydrogenase accessory protein XdhC [Hyphomicrobiales bacterium]MDE2114963.1 xanthine dehydrogenase accessory protein XdhC [Hyphomicrobiales bacterium]
MKRPITEHARRLLAQAIPAMVVEIKSTQGATPRDKGTAMLVTAETVHGSIGGGRMEWDAINTARKLLKSRDKNEHVLDVALNAYQGREGHLRLRIGVLTQSRLLNIEAFETMEEAAMPTVLLFGAGPVGQSLMKALAPLPLHSRWIEDRQHFAAGEEVVQTPHVLDEVAKAPAHSAFAVMTYSPTLDHLICASVLERGDFAYLGVVGSEARKQNLVASFRQLQIPEAQIARIACPMGGARLDKRPEVIAALAAAEILLALAPQSEPPL